MSKIEFECYKCSSVVTYDPEDIILNSILDITPPHVMGEPRITMPGTVKKRMARCPNQKCLELNVVPDDRKSGWGK
jgi:hypothetical protein